MVAKKRTTKKTTSKRKATPKQKKTFLDEAWEVEQKVAKEVKKDARIAKSESEKWIKKNPLKAVGVAAAIGVLAGLLLARKRK